jgi:hypothetical protein
LASSDSLKRPFGISWDLYPGPAEQFCFGTITNKRTSELPSKAVREQAYKIISILPKPHAAAPTKQKASNKRIVSVTLPTDEASLEYQYELLNCEDDIWFFSLKRFIDKVKIIIEKESGYEYEFLPLGGFPELHPGPDGILSYETIESGAGHLPHQGYLVQWYPTGRGSSGR